MHKLENTIGYRFRNQNLLEQALRHPSYANEQSPVLADNQRLEFLGDAALGLAVAEILYDNHPDRDEGFLTRFRSYMSNTRYLADCARKAGLGDFMLLGRGEQSSGGADRESNLADTLEAIIGAAYIDGGLEAVKNIVQAVILCPVDDLPDTWFDNPKGFLQEWAQSRGKSLPSYHIESETGPPHAKYFVVEVTVDGDVAGRGTGSSKREAEIAAAEAALLRLV